MLISNYGNTNLSWKWKYKFTLRYTNKCKNILRLPSGSPILELK